MKLASLHSGQHLILNSIPFTINRILENGDCTLERQSDLALVQKNKQELLTAFVNGNLKFIGTLKDPINENRVRRDITTLTENQQKEVNRKFQYVKAANDKLGNTPKKKGLNKVIDHIAMILADISPPSVSTAYRWWVTWKNNQKDIFSLLNRKSGSTETRKFRREARVLIDEVIDEVYLTTQKNSIATAYRRMKSRFKEVNEARRFPLKAPRRTTFYKIVGKRNPFEVLAAREGLSVAKKKFRATGKGVNTS